MHIMLPVVVAMQVLIFQFLPFRWSDALLARLTGSHVPSAGAAEVAFEWGRRARLRRAAGAVLLAVVLAAALTGSGAAWGKPLLAAVSASSAAVFVAGLLRDRAALAALSSRAPAPAIRTAGLNPRTLGDAYAAGWESLPIGLTALTLGATLWAVADGGPAWLFWIPGVQCVVALGGLVFSRSYARSGRQLSQGLRATVGDPHAAVVADERLRILELRALLCAKLGVVLLLAAQQTGSVWLIHGHEVPPLLEWGEWSVVGGLLACFGGYAFAATGVLRGLAASRATRP